MVIDRVPEGRGVAPLYLHVPSGYARDWRHHLRRIQRLRPSGLFVRDSWYKTVYVPEYHHRHGGPDYGHDHDHGYDHHGPEHGPDHQ